LIEKIRRWLGSEEIDADACPEAEAEAKRMAYDRDSIRTSQMLQGRGAGSEMTPTPDVLHPHEGD
jgi:hypothetical protein